MEAAVFACATKGTVEKRAKPRPCSCRPSRMPGVYVYDDLSTFEKNHRRYGMLWKKKVSLVRVERGCSHLPQGS